MIDTRPTRNLALDLVRVTESAALAAGRFMGRGDKNGADGASVNAMRLMLNTVQMDGVIVIGEGEKDQAPMLFNGEKLGTGEPPQLDIAVDPIDGTRPLAHGLPNSIAMCLVPAAPCLTPARYVQNKWRLAYARDVIDIEASITENLEKIAKAKGENVRDLTVVILDRPRHEEMIAEIRKCQARIRLIPDGDVAGALMTCLPETGIDVLMGIGGSPEAVLAAAAIRCLGGAMQCKLYARTPEIEKKGRDLVTIRKVLT